MNHVKRTRIYTCEIKRHRQIAPELCAICPRVAKCASFRAWYRIYNQEYLEFVLDIVEKFPEKYKLEVEFMAEKRKKKQHFVQIVDNETGMVDRMVNLEEIQAMSPEEQLELSRRKQLFIVSHKIEPIVKVTLRRSVIHDPIQVGENAEQKADQKKKASKPKATAKGKGSKKS